MMRVKKIFCAVMAAMMMLLASVSCSAAADESANAKLAKIEIDTYGSEQTGALLDRISRLEKDYSGQNMTGNMNARIEAIYNILYDNSAEPGVLAKINALEWNANHELAAGGIDTRLGALENMIIGKISTGTFNERIRALAKASYGAEILPTVLVQVPANTLIKVETTAPAGSKFLLEGDSLPVRVVEDVFVDGCLVFARGLPGEGTVTRVVRAKNIFSNGKIETDFHTLKTIDGQSAQTFAGIESIDAMTANSMARGLSLVGQTFSGKNKNLEEVFVRGKNIDLPAGVELYVQIKTPIVVCGVKADNGGLLLDEMITPAPATQPATNISTPAPEPETIIERVDTPPPSSMPTTEPGIESRPDEGKTLDGHDGEIIEIIDEE